MAHYSLAEKAYDVCLGMCNNKYDESVVEDSLRSGDLFTAGGYLHFCMLEFIQTGNFDTAEICLGKLGKNMEEFGDELSVGSYLSIKFFYQYKIKQVAQFFEDLDKNLEQSEKSAIELPRIRLMVTLGRMYVIKNDLSAAQKAIKKGIELLKNSGKNTIPSPFYLDILICLFHCQKKNVIKYT